MGRYLDDSKSVSIVAEKIDICETTVERWIRFFKVHVDFAFDKKLTNVSYTKEFKRKRML